MFRFFKKLFGIDDQITDAVTQPVPYKVEPPVAEKPHVLDVNKDGNVNFEDVKTVVTNVAEKVKKTADVDGDGKVTVKDAKAAVKKATNKVAGKMANKRGRKPKTKS
jgi:hypothetical protein